MYALGSRILHEGATVDSPNSPVVDTHGGNVGDLVLQPMRQATSDDDAEPAQTLHDRFSAISSGGSH